MNKYAASGWTVVQMDLDGGNTLRYGVGGVMSEVLDVQGQSIMAAPWALYMALCKLCGPAWSSSDNRGVVQAEKR